MLMQFNRSEKRRTLIGFFIIVLLFVLTAIINEKAFGLELLTPIKDNFQISSGVGFREHPMGGNEHSIHKGIDIVGPLNCEIRTVADGIVITHWVPPNGWYKGHPVYGGMVIIQHDGFYSLYAHLSKTFIHEGQKVSAGETIGLQGNTGISTGEHLHFELIIDPQLFFVEALSKPIINPGYLE